MTLKKTCIFSSLGLLTYLIWLFASMVDIVPTKNTTLNKQLQTELKEESNVIILREKAQRYLAINQDIRIRQSETVKKAFLILGGLLIIQLGLLAAEYKKAKNNGM